jgi:hypothetical protein
MLVCGILLASSTVAVADGELRILGDLSLYVDEASHKPAGSGPVIELAAFQEAEAPAPAPALQPVPDNAVPPAPAVPPSPPAEGTAACPGYDCPGCPSCQPTSGPIVIENGWGDVWGSVAGDWCCSGWIVGGVEGTFLVPLDEPYQFVRLTNLTNDESFAGTADAGLGAGVRTWLGLERDGTGIRARYWVFGNDRTNNDPVTPVPYNPAFHESYSLRATTFDLEVTHEFCFCDAVLDTSFGARYARLDRNILVSGFGTVGDVDLYGLAVGANEVEGTGFTASIGGRRPLGCAACCTNACPPCGVDPCCPPSGWHFYWNFRGSVLWADSATSALTEANAVTKPPIGAASANSRDAAYADLEHKENVFIADAQLGLEYQWALCCVPGVLAWKMGVEFQHWDTGDLLARSSSFAFLQGDPPPFGGQVEAGADGHDGDLDMIGFVLGLEWQF